jgi:hypothetical protein
VSGEKLVVPVPVELAQAIAEYLASRPYREVADALVALTSLQPIQMPSKDEE